MDDQEDQERAIKDFEMTQAGLERSRNGAAARSTAAGDEGDTPATVGTKRKFELDEDELDRITRQDKAKARKAIDDEKVGSKFTCTFSQKRAHINIWNSSTGC